LAVHVDTLWRPWLWWQCLTAGFAHSPDNFQHILFNMLVLFFLGRDVEQVYGPGEFLRLYLTLVAFASAVWIAVNNLLGAPGHVGAYGASGAVTGVVILYALIFPRRTLLLFFIIPIPAWVFGLLVVVLDMLGASQIGEGDSNVAYSMHLAGAAFAFAYHRAGWNLSRLGQSLVGRISLRRKPCLRVHRPEEPQPPSNLNVEVDRILEKIYREGESALSAQERKTLEAASRQYQQKRRGEDG